MRNRIIPICVHKNLWASPPPHFHSGFACINGTIISRWEGKKTETCPLIHNTSCKTLLLYVTGGCCTLDTLFLRNSTMDNSLVTLGRVERITNQITYFIFDNQLVNSQNGSTAFLSEVLLFTIAIFSIKNGSYASIEQPRNALLPNENHPLFDPSDKDVEPIPKEEHISTETALLMPVFAGASLVAIYYFIKSTNVNNLNNFLQIYLLFASFASVSFTLSFHYNTICRNISHSKGIDINLLNKRYAITISNDTKVHPLGFEKEWFCLPNSNCREQIIKEEALLEVREDVKKSDQLVNYYISSGTIFGTAFGFIYCILYLYLIGPKNWVLNNFLGYSIVVWGISKTKVPNFRIAVLLLTLFFIYDVYFVFGTDVMVSVATKLEVPAKLIMPVVVSREFQTIETSILGLGDLALPGIFIALCLRFDLFMFHEKNKNHEFHHLQPFEKNYFTAALIGYFIGLKVTFKIVQIYRTGQPALLYLVPSMLFVVFFTAYRRKELQCLWEYSEVDEAEMEEVELKCSKGTLYLAAEIDEVDYDDENDPDWLCNEDDIDEEDLNILHIEDAEIEIE